MGSRAHDYWNLKSPIGGKCQDYVLLHFTLKEVCMGEQIYMESYMECNG